MDNKLKSEKNDITSGKEREEKKREGKREKEIFRGQKSTASTIQFRFQ